MSLLPGKSSTRSPTDMKWGSVAQTSFELCEADIDLAVMLGHRDKNSFSLAGPPNKLNKKLPDGIPVLRHHPLRRNAGPQAGLARARA